MSTNKSLLKLEAEKCKSVPTARDQAAAILARMNDMLRVRSFFEVHVEKKFNQLNERLHALGWLGLIKKFTRKGGKYYAQLKLVDPDSEEARSVYVAERFAERLAGTPGIEVEVKHTARQHWCERNTTT